MRPIEHASRRFRPREARSRRGWPPSLALSLALSLGGTACSAPPPEAPEDYQALMAYLFTYMQDDSGRLAEGLLHLSNWLDDEDHAKEVLAGFSVSLLDETAVDMLDERDRSAEALLGISVLTESPHSPEAIASLLTWPSFGEVLKDNYDVYDRSFREPPECFGRRQCTSLEADSHTESKWGGLISVKTDYTIQFRWVETRRGWMLLHRFWLKDTAKGSCCGVVMYGNYYLGVTMPGPDGGAARIHANWFRVDGGDLGFLAGDPAARVVSSTRDDAKRVDTWISKHATPAAP